MDRRSVDWRGYIPAIVTPFDAAGELDFKRLDRMLEWLIAEGVHGIVVCGTTGEWFSLSAREKRRLFTRVGEVVGGRIPVIGGCNAFTAHEALETAGFAEAARFDGILLAPPPYVKPSDAEIIAFYTSVAAGCRLPMTVYNWPPGTNIDMPPRLLEQLAAIDTVVAIKNSSANVAAYAESFFALRDRVRTFGFASNELGLSLLRNEGLDGTMGAAATLGRDHPDFYNAVWAGDLVRARDLMQRDALLMRELFNADLTARYGSAQAVFKEALNQQGIDVGQVRLPILPVDDEGRAAIRRTLLALGKRADG